MDTETQSTTATRPAPSAEQMNIVIVGHVDHGKSTIIGRLLADSGSLPQGKLEQIRELCARTSKPFEYAFLLDALKDEQSQGITIDAARVFFKSDQRHYIIIDAPGHIEFLKNMITGASRAEAALLVIDAAEGVRENSRRHGYMLGMLGIRNVAVLVNKMDRVGYQQDVFESVRQEYQTFLNQIDIQAIAFVPVSGMQGDNIVEPMSRMPWYAGPTVLEVLDSFKNIAPDRKLPFRMPVQDVYKFTRFGDSRRIVAGTISTGSLNVGDDIVFYPSGKATTVASIERFPEPAPGDSPLQKSHSGDAVGFTLTEQLYITRGEIAAVSGQQPPTVATRLRASIFWLARAPLTPGRDILLRVGTAKVRARLESVSRVLDASSLESQQHTDEIRRHDVADCILHCSQPIAFDPSTDLAETGRFVIIQDYEIAGGGIIHEGLADKQTWIRDHVLQRNIKWERSAIERTRRTGRYRQTPALILVTGARDSRKKDISKALEEHLFTLGRITYYLGFGSVLYGVDADLKATHQDSLKEYRREHVRRFAEVAHLFLDSGTILISTAIDLTAEDLELIQTVVQSHRILVIWSDGQPTTDIDADISLPKAMDEPDAIAHIKSVLQQEGVLFSANEHNVSLDTD